MASLPERHPWAPYIPEHARVWILGTFPPKPNRWSMNFYYPNRINDFWRIIGLIFKGDKDALYDPEAKTFRLDEIKKILNRYGIALGDSARAVNRLKDNASDKFLEIVEPVPLYDVLTMMPECHDLASTGEKAAAVIAEITGTSIPKIGEYASVTRDDGSQLRIWRMPSTSRAYPLPLPQKAAYYEKLFRATGILK
ncbi:MAG: DNA glycosylase [Pseudoflavonifractor sp.]|nr:DNA glycosylase [Pseudoflavonifractor sp.]